MKTQFTSGPWKVELKERTGIGKTTVCMRDCEGARFAPVCTIENGNGNALHLKISPEEQMSNATLIAAAPELFEACQAAFENLDPLYPENHDVMIKLRYALAKARGKI